MEKENIDKNFDELLVSSIKEQLLLKIQKTDWVSVGYQRVELPQNILQKVLVQISPEKIIERLKDRIEDRIADSIFNNMVTEMTNDTKQILSNKELREEIRSMFRTKIKEAATYATK